MPDRMPQTPPAPTDEELDVYIKIRYRLLGIDISVLPADDEKAPMDQKRLLANGRDILRQEVVDPQFHLPMPFVPQLTVWTEEDR
jgi:tyrosyl-tRNA synthetase